MHVRGGWGTHDLPAFIQGLHLPATHEVSLQTTLRVKHLHLVIWVAERGGVRHKGVQRCARARRCRPPHTLPTATRKPTGKRGVVWVRGIAIWTRTVSVRVARLLKVLFGPLVRVAHGQHAVDLQGTRVHEKEAVANTNG